MTKAELIKENERLKDEVRQLSFVDDCQRQEIARLRNLLDINFRLDEIMKAQRAWEEK